MSEKFVDRKSTYPNRYKITKADGTVEYVTLERADQPTVAGTPLNAETFNKVVNEIDGKLSKTGGTMSGGLVTPLVDIRDPNYPQLVFGDADSATGLVYQNANTGEIGFRQMGANSNLFDDLVMSAPSQTLSGASRYVLYNSRDAIVLRNGIHYGDELPPAGVPGRIFFKKVT